MLCLSLLQFMEKLSIKVHRDCFHFERPVKREPLLVSRLSKKTKKNVRSLRTEFSCENIQGRESLEDEGFYKHGAVVCIIQCLVFCLHLPKLLLFIDFVWGFAVMRQAVNYMVGKQAACPGIQNKFNQSPWNQHNLVIFFQSLIFLQILPAAPRANS